MNAVLSSRNKKKIVEMERLLGEGIEGLRLLSLDDVGISGDAEETGLTFEENALIKAAVAASMGYIGVADDSGLAVDVLDGAPGVYSARYAGAEDDEHKDRKNNAKLLTVMQDVPDEKRTAKFVSVVACALPEGMEAEIPAELLKLTRGGLRAFAVRGECAGTILHEEQGEGGFGYDPLFYVEEKGKTFAQLTADEKNAISHRGRAMRSFGEAFADVFSKKNRG
jgi:XTP/dITP diphosphohydrolase